MNPESDPTPLPAPDPETGGPWVEFWRGSRGPLILALALTVAHFAWLRFHFAPAIMSPDANGYVVQARLLAEAGRTWFTAESPVQYIGMHWLETAAGVFHSRYPAGLPLLFAAAWKLGGLDAALLVNPLLASATVLLVFFLARRLAGGWPGLIAAAVVASVPVANQHALDGDAHIAAAFFLVAGTLALLRFAAARTMGWGLLAGGLLGIVPTVRYPEAIAGVTIGAWLLWRIRPAWRIWPAVVGATVPIACLLAHNAAAYGAFWRTGYALTNEQTGFGLGYLAIHAVPYLQSLGGQGLALFFAFGTAGLAALATDRRWRAEGVLFAGLVTPLLLVYMAYYFGGPGGGAAAGNLRFLIPTFPFFAVAGAWLLARVAGDLGCAGRVAVAVVVALQLFVAGASSISALARTKSSLTAAAGARAVAAKAIPAGSIVIVDRNLAESLDAVGRWRLVEESLVAGTGPRLGPGGPMRPTGGAPANGDDADQPNPHQVGKNRVQQERYAGLNASGRRVRVWSDIVTWAGGRPIYWFARSVELVESALPLGGDYESIAEVDAPTMGGPGGMGGPGSGMGPMMSAGPGLPGRGGRGGMPGRALGPLAEPGLGGPPGRPGRGPGLNLNAPAAKLRVVRISIPKT